MTEPSGSGRHIEPAIEPVKEPVKEPAKEPAANPALRRRVSDAEREDVAEILRDAAGEGRLSYAELEERLEVAYGARTYRELVEITHDLPGSLAAAQQEVARRPPQPVTAREPIRMTAFFSEVKRSGAWSAPRQLEVRACLGGVQLDFSEARMPDGEIDIDVDVLLGETKIRVPENAIVHLEGNPILGEVSEQRPVLGADERTSGTPPVFRVRARAILGEVKILRGQSAWRRMFRHRRRGWPTGSQPRRPARQLTTAVRPRSAGRRRPGCR